jgi:hypothetical protein
MKNINPKGIKYFLLTALLFCGLGGRVFAAPEYPPVINNGTILINTGLGWGSHLTGNKGEFNCPPLAASLDYALPFGTLPFTFGLAFGFSSESLLYGQDFNNFGFAARIAYHFDIPLAAVNIYRRLDTYGLVILGGILETNRIENERDAWWTFGGGVRYFFLPWFGAYMEIGFSNFTIISGGLSFRL